MIPENIKNVIRPAYRAFVDLLPPRWHVMLEYFRVYHRLPDLKNPQSFGEKIMSRKLYDRNKRLPDLADKIKVKEILGQKFGADFVIPTLAVYARAEDMDFTKPPLNAPPYVLKTNHASGTNIFVRNKEDLREAEKIRQEMAVFLKIKYGDVAEEWAYSQVTPKILVEPYIETDGGLTDYKFHVFSGRVFAVEVVTERFSNYGVSFHTRDWQAINLGYVGRYPRAKNPLPPPGQLAKMIEIAEAIGKDFSYVRADLYQINAQVKLGELTFYPGAGHDKFDDDAWDLKFGQQWKPDWPLQG